MFYTLWVTKSVWAAVVGIPSIFPLWDYCIYAFVNLLENINNYTNNDVIQYIHTHNITDYALQHGSTERVKQNNIYVRISGSPALYISICSVNIFELIGHEKIFASCFCSFQLFLFLPLFPSTIQERHIIVLGRYMLCCEVTSFEKACLTDTSDK